MSAMMTVKEIAKQLKCSESFVYNLLASGELKHYCLGKGQGGKRVSEEQLQEYLKGREKGGAPQQHAEPPAPRVKTASPGLKHLSLD
jgi:excisionase family DNA binding protein